MSAPERIWIDHHGGNWSPRSGGTQEHEYVRADLVEAAVKRALEWAAEKSESHAAWLRKSGISAMNHDMHTVASDIRAATPDQIAKLAKGE